MRIKKYENWKLATTNRPNTTFNRSQKISDLFLISQLLQTPKKTTPNQSEHHYDLTDPKAINRTFNLTRSNFSKNDIQINLFVRPFNRELRDEAIKNKIKQRIKQEFSQEVKDEPNSYFLGKPTEKKLSESSIQQTKTEPRESRVFVRGNSVAFGSVGQKKRSKSSFMRTSLPNFSQKNKLIQIEGFKKMESEARQKMEMNLVEIKRKISSSFAARQKRSVSALKKKNSLKQIDPWQIDEGPHVFEL